MQLPRPRLPPAPRNAGRVGKSTGDARENERRAQGGQSRENRDAYVFKMANQQLAASIRQNSPWSRSPKIGPRSR